jgi:hypothetical protein
VKLKLDEKRAGAGDDALLAPSSEESRRPETEEVGYYLSVNCHKRSNKVMSIRSD